MFLKASQLYVDEAKSNLFAKDLKSIKQKFPEKTFIYYRQVRFFIAVGDMLTPLALPDDAKINRTSLLYCQSYKSTNPDSTIGTGKNYKIAGLS